VLETILLAITAFASTNIDDAFVLLAFFGDPRLAARDVVIGQYAGMAALTIAAIVFALLAYAIPDRYIGWTGVLPILIGATRLWQAWRAKDDDAAEEVTLGPLGGIAAVAGVTIADGGDNIAVYVPLFAKASMSATLAICAVFMVMVVAWCLAALYLIRHRVLGALVHKWGRRVTPLALIALGVYILLRNGTVPI
jgi:cadmium resistance protein CadD (predicted permease)